ncbi:hypothetical protein SDC9_74802 [bioreactor metagenome]|uniref:Uncharacterized protein n=1 Tax=bioreactor metagenome TaxID=1076179 RepID=A0A644YI34_9ZZZZ
MLFLSESTQLIQKGNALLAGDTKIFAQPASAEVQNRIGNLLLSQGNINWAEKHIGGKRLPLNFFLRHGKKPMLSFRFNAGKLTGSTVKPVQFLFVEVKGVHDLFLLHGSTQNGAHCDHLSVAGSI